MKGMYGSIRKNRSLIGWTDSYNIVYWILRFKEPIQIFCQIYWLIFLEPKRASCHRYPLLFQLESAKKKLKYLLLVDLETGVQVGVVRAQVVNGVLQGGRLLFGRFFNSISIWIRNIWFLAYHEAICACNDKYFRWVLVDSWFYLTHISHFVKQFSV